MEFSENSFMLNSKDFIIKDKEIEITTTPFTDFWNQTYYRFSKNNAPALLKKTSEKYFSFIVKTEFDTHNLFDQCGIMIFIDNENWFKASIEFENNCFQRLGSVVTNHGFSDWASTNISNHVKSMYYRLSRRENDFMIENSCDGICFKQMRIFHLFKADDSINFGIYASSPENSQFKAHFKEFEVLDCTWKKHA